MYPPRQEPWIGECGLLGIFLLGMFSRRANTAGALLGLGTGLAALVLVMSIPGIPSWWYGAFVIFPTLLVGFVSSHGFAPPSADALAATVGGTSAGLERMNVP